MQLVHSLKLEVYKDGMLRLTTRLKNVNLPYYKDADHIPENTNFPIKLVTFLGSGRDARRAIFTNHGSCCVYFPSFKCSPSYCLFDLCLIWFNL